VTQRETGIWELTAGGRTSADLGLGWEDNKADVATASQPIVRLHQRWDSAAELWVYGFSVSQGGVFPVTVEKTSGSDGSLTTTASWTYTVRTLAGTTLGTGVAVTRPRPKGLMTFQAGSAYYGLAFYDSSGALILWDAGEIPTMGACA